MDRINITKISSRGQIVIPHEMRKGFEKGERLIIMQNDKQIILKKEKDFEPNIKEDLEFAKRTEEAWKSYDKGEFISQPANEFLEELKKC